MSTSYKYLFGPVPSRRLGRSLGVDLIPFKTCTMNCSFCQLGNSEQALTERLEYVPTADVIAELEQWKKEGGVADHITLAGSGEPTLHTGFGDVLAWIKDNMNCPSVLLSNGSLFHLPEVREAAAFADKVKVTLSAWDQASFERIHCPAPGVLFDHLLEGEYLFSHSFAGELSVEVFLVDGVNSDPSDVRKMAGLIEQIDPDWVDLNTAIRPPADTSVREVSFEKMSMLLKEFGANARITASFKTTDVKEDLSVTADSLVGLIHRHPATAEQLALDFNKPLEWVLEQLNPLVADGTLLEKEQSGASYYYHRDS